MMDAHVITYKRYHERMVNIHLWLIAHGGSPLGMLGHLAKSI
jgi:hypothetical protein